MPEIPVPITAMSSGRRVCIHESVILCPRACRELATPARLTYRYGCKRPVDPPPSFLRTGHYVCAFLSVNRDIRPLQGPGRENGRGGRQSGAERAFGPYPGDIGKRRPRRLCRAVRAFRAAGEKLPAAPGRGPGPGRGHGARGSAGGMAQGGEFRPRQGRGLDLGIRHRAQSAHRRAAPRAPSRGERRTSGSRGRYARGRGKRAFGGATRRRIAPGARGFTGGTGRGGGAVLFSGPAPWRARTAPRHPAWHGEIALAPGHGAAARGVGRNRMSTRQPEHHPSEAVLVAYGSGALGEGLALVVATHLLYCAACRAKARDVEALGGALLEELPPTALAEDAYAKTLPRLGAVEAKPARQHRPPANGGFSPPGPLGDYLGGHVSENDWRRIMPRLSRVVVLPRGKAGANTQLLRVAPGTALAHHGHRGLELTVVLQGGYSDDLGHFGVGDVAETDDAIRHRPVADPGADCICLIATSGRLRFSGLIGRLIQPFIGM